MHDTVHDTMHGTVHDTMHGTVHDTRITIQGPVQIVNNYLPKGGGIWGHRQESAALSLLETSDFIYGYSLLINPHSD